MYQRPVSGAVMAVPGDRILRRASQSLPPSSCRVIRASVLCGPPVTEGRRACAVVRMASAVEIAPGIIEHDSQINPETAP